jgi:ubiquinone/menaquinone biosynthesis C-methylase UbiE
VGSSRVDARSRFDLWGRSGLYDGLSRLSFGRSGRRLREQLVDELGPQPGDRVLDVATGTGQILPYLAVRVGHTGRVVGLDLSEGMLDRARQRTEHLATVELVQGDAARLPFADASFDLVLSTYGLSCIRDVGPVVAEMVRVTAPAGTIGVAEASTVNWGIPVVNRAATAIASPFNTWYPRREVAPFLEAAGLHIRRVRGDRGPLEILVASRR